MEIQLLFSEFPHQLGTCSFSSTLVKPKDMGRFSFNGLFSLPPSGDHIIILGKEWVAKKGGFFVPVLIFILQCAFIC